LNAARVHPEQTPVYSAQRAVAVILAAKVSLRIPVGGGSLENQGTDSLDFAFEVRARLCVCGIGKAEKGFEWRKRLFQSIKAGVSFAD
jgi:hypothetical protein